MDEIMKQYGPMIIVIIVVVALVAIVGTLLADNGVVHNTLESLINNFSSVALDSIPTPTP